MQGGSICAIHQPNFLPRLTTLAKLYAADYWIVLDNVQFVRRDYQHRSRLAALHDVDARQWLSLPVHLRSGRSTTIADVQLVQRAESQHRVDQLLRQFYRRSPHWPCAQRVLDDILHALDASDRLAAVAEASTRSLLAILGWQGRIVHGSELTARTGRSERLSDLAEAVGTRRYLCGTGGATYIDLAPFEQAGLAIEYFATPQDPSTIWRCANRITTLWALMSAGPNRVAAELREHAATWRL